mgnify:CR=1 FL=1
MFSIDLCTVSSAIVGQWGENVTLSAAVIILNGIPPVLKLPESFVFLIVIVSRIVTVLVFNTALKSLACLENVCAVFKENNHYYVSKIILPHSYCLFCNLLGFWCVFMLHFKEKLVGVKHPLVFS